jgi:nuclear pore complex protein Nup133
MEMRTDLWLCSAAAADETGTERERQELEEKFGQLRPEVLETLRKPMNHV